MNNRDRIGCYIFFGEEDNPTEGTIQIEYTDMIGDELYINLRTNKKNMAVYVTFELFKKLYAMAMKEIDLEVVYNSSVETIIEGDEEE